jgi:hypothetical protein
VPLRVMACWLGLMFALFSPAAGWAGNLISLDELTELRLLADQGSTRHVAQRKAVLAAAQRPWRWGSVSGEFVTTLDGTTKRCHPTDDPAQIDFLKEGAPDAYAMVLGYLISTPPDPALAEEARARLLDLTDTTGFHGLFGDDASASNQCVLDLAVSIPVWIETATLLASTPVWTDADRNAFALWLAAEVYPRVAWASRVRRNNWGTAGSASASLVARYVDGIVFTLADPGPPGPTAITPAEAVRQHDAMQLERIGTSWRGDTECTLVGIQPHGGIPDELRRGAAGCDGTFLPADDDPSHTYQTMHVELLVLHAEAQRRNGSTALYDARLAGGTPAILQSILFVIANPTPGGRSWPWGIRTGTLAVAYRHYGDARLGRELDRSTSPNARGGRTLPYATLGPLRPTPPSISLQ